MLFNGARRNKLADDVRNDLLAQLGYLCLGLVTDHELIALLVHDLALIIGNIVVFKQVFADIEVMPFDFALRVFYGLGDPRVFYRFALLHA